MWKKPSRDQLEGDKPFLWLVDWEYNQIFLVLNVEIDARIVKFIFYFILFWLEVFSIRTGTRSSSQKSKVEPKISADSLIGQTAGRCEAFLIIDSRFQSFVEQNLRRFHDASVRI